MSPRCYNSNHCYILVLHNSDVLDLSKIFTERSCNGSLELLGLPSVVWPCSWSTVSLIPTGSSFPRQSLHFVGPKYDLVSIPSRNNEQIAFPIHWFPNGKLISTEGICWVSHGYGSIPMPRDASMVLYPRNPGAAVTSATQRWYPHSRPSTQLM